MFACFKKKSVWDAWIAHVGPRAYPCADCTAEFKAQSIADETCRHPETVFRRDEDGFISGVCAGMSGFKHLIPRGEVPLEDMRALHRRRSTHPGVAMAIAKVLKAESAREGARNTPEKCQKGESLEHSGS